MKSEKAKEFIRRIIPNEANFKYCAISGRLNGSIYTDVCKVVELAEQEAEDRMRHLNGRHQDQLQELRGKAVEAFASCCQFNKGEYCNHANNFSRLCDAIQCPFVTRFIQKLNEE